MDSLTNKINVQGKKTTEIQEQIRRFETGFPYLPITEPAKLNDGIKAFTNEELEFYINWYSYKAPELKVIKFIPASGAASRMFKVLYNFLNQADQEIPEDGEMGTFFSQLDKFPFFDDLDKVFREKGSSLESVIKSRSYSDIVSNLITEKGLGYGHLPKGLIKFHQYEDHERSPVYEHFVEGLLYAMGKDNIVRLHFTVPPDHLMRFMDEAWEIQNQLEAQYKIRFEVDFSVQKNSTDTLAVNMDNSPFEKEDGSILFRPGGHGALLENLNEIEGDLIFIKNIDNVSRDRVLPLQKTYKKAMAGLLLEIQEMIFASLRDLNEDPDGAAVEKAEDIINRFLGIKLPERYARSQTKDKVAFLIKKLNRPIRVCGMVRNLGEPGGGPFWVKDEDGSIGLQIAEKAQIDPAMADRLLQDSTHFNPVDIVCGIIDYKGKRFELTQFRDASTGLISEKSLDGKKLKALELPGLWNGAMADWNTIFVEMPLELFNPVKTINDLLRKEHQSSGD